MIDTLFQGQIDKNLDDQVRRPQPAAPQQPSTFAGFWRGLGGIPGGAALGFGSAVDVAQGVSRIELSQGLVYNPATHSYTQIGQDDASRADAATIKAGHVADLFTSDTGDTFRAVAKDYMPDPQTTGKAGQILGQGSAFMTQAIPAMAFGGPLGPGLIGTAAGMQEADRLREQGVDQRTRMEAGGVAAVGTAAAMVLPMSGPTALVRFGKGAVGGVVSSVAQTQAEKLVLEHRGYDQIAGTFDPFDPVSLAINALVPGLTGAAVGHASGVRAPDGITADTSAAARDLRTQNDIEALQREIARPGNSPEQLEILRGELARAQSEHASSTVKAATTLEPDLEAAARVKQTADAMDSSRLTRDDDLVGRDQHQQALETAADQLGRGDPVDVSAVFGDQLGAARESRALADRIDMLEEQRAQLLGDAGNALGPREVADLRDQVAHLQSQLVDAGPTAVKGRAKELQGQDVSYKKATAQAQRELSAKLADQQATIERLQQRLEQHAVAAQATEKIGGVERDLAAAREQQAQLPGPATTPRRLSLAMADVYRELGRAPAAERTRANPEAFRAARAEADATAAAADSSRQGEATSAPPAPQREAGSAPATRESEAGPSDAHLDAAIAALDPNLMVHMDGMEHAVPLAELLDRLRAEAAEQGRDSKLIEVAAQCALSFPAAG